MKRHKGAGRIAGELWTLAVALGRAEGTTYLYKLLIKNKIGTHDIESESAKVWSESVQRGVKQPGGEEQGGLRNVKIIMKKLELVREEAVIIAKERRKNFEHKFREEIVKSGIELGTRRAKKIKLKLEGERVRAFQEDKQRKEDKVEHLRKKYGNRARVQTVEDDDNAMLYGIQVTDEELMGMEEDQTRMEDVVADGVKVDSDEWALLRLPPKNAVFDKLTTLKAKCEFEEGNAKQRWGRKKEEEMMDYTEEERKEKDDIDSRQIFNIEENIRNQMNMRVTDTKFNRRTVLPKERNIEEESMVEFRKNL